MSVTELTIPEFGTGYENARLVLKRKYYYFESADDTGVISVKLPDYLAEAFLRYIEEYQQNTNDE